MGMEANILCIGQFKKTIAKYLDYEETEYEDTNKGVAVISMFFHCNSSQQSLELAEAVGVEPFNFNTHQIERDKVRWCMLQELCDKNPEWANYHIEALKALLDAGFICIYQPNY